MGLGTQADSVRKSAPKAVLSQRDGDSDYISYLHKGTIWARSGSERDLLAKALGLGYAVLGCAGVAPSSLRIQVETVILFLWKGSLPVRVQDLSDSDLKLPPHLCSEACVQEWGPWTWPSLSSHSE